MIHYEKLRPLIFQNQKSIEKYGIDYRGGINSVLYDELNKVKGLRQEKPSNIGCDQLFLDIFNDVYFIITLVFMFKRPEHYIEDVYLVIAEKGNQSKNMIRTWAVMGMVLAILKHLNKCSFIHLPEGDKFIKRIEDAIQVWFDEGDEMKRNVAKKMCEAILSVNMLIDKNVFFPIPLTSNFLKHINWGQYITLFDFDTEFSSSYIGGNDVEELLLFLGRFTQEKYNVVLSLMEYVKNMRKKDNREPVVINYEGALAHLEFYEQKWHPKKDSPTVEELTAPKQPVFPELQYLYSGETPNVKNQSKKMDMKPNSAEKRSGEDELPSVEEMAAACEKTKKESLWWGNASWSVTYRIYCILGYKGSQQSFINEVKGWPFKKPFDYKCNRHSLSRPLRSGKISGPLEKWAASGALTREVQLGERLMDILKRKENAA